MKRKRVNKSELYVLFAMITSFTAEHTYVHIFLHIYYRTSKQKIQDDKLIVKPMALSCTKYPLCPPSNLSKLQNRMTKFYFQLRNIFSFLLDFSFRLRLSTCLYCYGSPQSRQKKKVIVLASDFFLFDFRGTPLKRLYFSFLFFHL